MEAAGTASVLLLDLSTSALGGIDLLSFTTTPRFKGIRNVPPGWHFVFTSTTSSVSVRHGAWFFVKEKSGPPELFVKRWDASKEELVAETDIGEQLRWRKTLGSIWRENLAPYRQTTGKDASEAEAETRDWQHLTNCISEKLLSRITGPSDNHWSLTSASSAARDMDVIPGLPPNISEIQREKELNFLPIDLKRTWRHGAIGRERTEAALDHSWALDDLVKHHSDGGGETHILGELQFCFLMVLTLSNYSCLEQWKRLLELIFTSKAAVKEHADFFVQAVTLLKLQLQHSGDVDGGLFDLSDEGASFLKSLLRKFKQSLNDISGKGKSEVMDELEELEGYLRSEYRWELDNSFVKRGLVELEDGEKVELEVAGFDEEDETGEYAPTVVNLTPEQLSALSMSDSTGRGAAEVAADSEEDQDLDDMDTRY
ncbi:hypothetical protein EJ06DRAFT_538880 [Trichodelitschia bisporula]|uniref:AAR2 domain-containing protein n=1 Tax=Trichodelitschia bisporula TaxID=703511 RepID=A0A6G1HRG2_9PEZI|nr:hypothetical protein EJ06DRAFT_538880 [Trichodelitschia bisporula]